MDLFRVRLNCIDHYQSQPTVYDPQLRNDVRLSQTSKRPKVPVVRIFGSTETGQKVCAHVHGAFPYLYVDYDGSLKPEEVGAYIYRLHLSIDHALAVSYRRDQHRENHAFVARITLAKGIPFYGFHVGYRPFLKIYMLNPVVMTRLADLLQQGVIMKHKFQPYEAHLQYLAQFMIDYNLYGCDYVESSKTAFRSPVPDRNDSGTPHLWHSQSVPLKNITDSLDLPRVSHCSIEVDISVQHIVNREKVNERQLHHDFVERTKPIPSDLKLVSSMAGLWKDETRRRKMQMSQTQSGSPFPPEALVSMSADERDSQPQGWIHEAEYMSRIQATIQAESSSLSPHKTLDFESFVEPLYHSGEINTTLQSVEDLYPFNLNQVLGLSSSPAELNFDPASSIEVDEKKLRQVHGEEDDFFPDDSDEDMFDDLVERAQNDVAATSKGSSGENIFEEVDPHSAADPESVKSEYGVTGVYASSFQTGEIAIVPFSAKLLEEAEDSGFIGRTPESYMNAVSGLAARKRQIIGNVGDSHSKRQKQDAAAFTPKNKTNDTSTEPVKSGISRSRLHRSTSHGSASSNAGLANQTLNFAIVKDKQDQGTSIQLSQKESTSSQDPSDTQRKKQVAFEATTFELTSSQADFFSSMSSLSPMSTPQPVLSAAQRAAIDSCQRAALVFATLPPSASEALSDINPELPDKLYQDAFYSKDKDVPQRLREYAGREFRLEGNSLPFLPEFDPTGTSPATYGIKGDASLRKTTLDQDLRRRRRDCSCKIWEIARPPPSFNEVEKHFARGGAAGKDANERTIVPKSTQRWLSQIDGPTPKNKHGFKYSQKQKSTSVQHEVQYMSTMSLEVHVNTRGKFVPNPEEDEIQCIFWACTSDDLAALSQGQTKETQSGILALSPNNSLAQRIQRMIGCEATEENSELELINRMIEVVRRFDPDILTGYEVHGGSWGYLIERARVKYEYSICDELSRMKSDSHSRFGRQEDRWGFNTTSTIRITGRHMINIWRAMRGELNLLQYTMENVVWHLLHRRIPHYSWKTLTSWYRSGRVSDLSKLLRYYHTRTKLNLDILDSNELIARTSEQARLLGVDFFSVFSRGSQFKVESIMFRIAKPENFLLVSPSKKQVGGQNALECLPLVMEPQSAFYSSPVLVLDFQSLYPSVMIAYNYCYSTFLGRISDWRGKSKMGFTDYKRQSGLLPLLQDHINIAPNGIMYAKADIRKSLLAKMLTEILETRVMVKSGMKQDKDDRTLQQLLNNRQLALKLLANVTYGYTSASFSGRMPCSEIADSIVQTGRETLERAIAYIHSVERWGAEVVYGDTDSLFIHLKGRTKDQAFDIGNEISKAITDMNPRPVKLKFEKVYLPCVLLAKKRYVGYMYESRDQVKPEFDAKGIETVRRDGTPAEQKIEEKALRLLFETADLSQIKEYFQKQCTKIMRGAVSVQDFCFAKEVRLGSYSDKGLPPAGALISTKRMLEDARAEPQYGERVPYVVISGAPGARLIDRCVAPEDLLDNPHWHLDAEYYISKNLIPPLERIFNLVGANVRQWYDEMPKVHRVRHVAAAASTKRSTLESYMQSAHCLVCGAKFAMARDRHALCPPCRRVSTTSLLALQTRLAAEERKYQEVVSLCQTCSGLSPLEEVRCDSKDCPVFWSRVKQGTRVAGERASAGPVIRALAEGADKASLEW